MTRVMVHLFIAATKRSREDNVYLCTVRPENTLSYSEDRGSILKSPCS